MLTPGVRIVRGPDWSWNDQGIFEQYLLDIYIYFL